MSLTRTLQLGVNVDLNTADNNPGMWSDVAIGCSGWFAPAAVVGTWNVSGYPTTNGMQTRCSMAGCTAGVYVIQFQGTAILSVKWATLSGVTKSSSGVSMATITVAAANSPFVITVTGLNPADPLRDLHIYAPGETAPFRQQFGKWLSPFSVLRAIDWVPTNIDKTTVTANTPTPATTWASRVQPTSWDQTSRGTAYEFFLSLCELAKCDAWLNVPLAADDDFAKQLATLAGSYKINTIYVEVGNEVWNQSFGQWLQNYNNANGANAAQFDGNITPSGIVKTTPLSTDPNTRARRCYAERVRHVGQIFRAALGAKVKVVLAGQTVNPAIIDNGLSWIAAKYGDVAKSFDCIAPAAYFPGSTPAPSATLQEIADACTAFIAGDLTTYLKAHKVLADKYSLALVGYEGGHSLQSWNNPLGSPTDLPWMIQTAPVMNAIYQQWLNACQAAGMTLVLHNSLIRPWTKTGMFSLQQNQLDSPGPKWSAISSFATAPISAPNSPVPPVIPSVPMPVTSQVTLGGVTYNVTYTQA